MTLPIEDEILAERAIDLFLAGYDPLLYAADLGLTPDTVVAQIRHTLRLHIDAAVKLRRPNAGRKRIENPTPATLRSRKHREKSKNAT